MASALSSQAQPTTVAERRGRPPRPAPGLARPSRSPSGLARPPQPAPGLARPSRSPSGLARPQQPPAELTRVAWRPHGELGLAEWSAVGRRFGEIGRASQWWLGDWIRYGNERFGERYTRAAKLTGYDAQSLMNMVYVSSRFAVYRRRENLSWSHHAALAALERDGQEHWLERASAQRLSVADLRVELRSRRRALAAAGAGDQPPARPAANQPSPERATGSETRVCPNCGEPLPLSA